VGATVVRSRQTGDGDVKRDDLNTTEAGQAVIRKLADSTSDIQMSSNGADGGTGDVTIGIKPTQFKNTQSSIVAASTISSVARLAFLTANSGETELTSNHQIASGFNGQIIYLRETSDTNFVTLVNGNGLVLSTSKYQLKNNRTLTLIYDGGVGYETSRSVAVY